MSLGWSQRDLAARMGYKNHSAVARAESGAVDLPQSKVEQFAQVLGVTPGYLMGWVEESTSEKNSQLAKLTIRMRNDEDFYNTVVALAELNESQYQGIKQILSAFNE
jgi:transcriptional regulator with XRE-family HTH domain